MKTVALIFALFPFVVHAATFEVGIGGSSAITKNGRWYQDGFTHTLQTHPAVAYLGADLHAAHGVHLHLDAIDLGRMSSDSMDTPRDSNYSGNPAQPCNGSCLPLVRYMGHGHVWGVQALVERRTAGAWQLGIEGGLMAYRTAWHMQVPQWYPGTDAADVIPIDVQGARWALGPVIGATLTHGAWSLAGRYYGDGAHVPKHGTPIPQTGSWPPLWSGQFTLTAQVTF